MIEFKVETEGINPYKLFKWQRAVSAWSNEMGPLIVSEMRAKAPVSKKPGGGRFRDSITYERRVTPRTSTMMFTSNRPEARYLTEGTPPHLIQPRRASALHWTGQGGEDIYSMLVHHPGMKPNPFARNAVQKMMPLMQRRFREIVQAELRGV